MTKPITAQNMISLMESIIRYLYKNNATDMVNFYVNNKHYSSEFHEGYIQHSLGNQRHYWEDSNPCDVTKQIEYNNPKTITITFEGPMYHDINYGPQKILRHIEKLANTYGLYPELGYAWSLALYEI